jgi:hypothetical protein
MPRTVFAANLEGTKPAYGISDTSGKILVRRTEPVQKLKLETLA